MSAAERKREERRRRRRAIREVTNAVEDTRAKCDDLRKARDAAWEAARAALREKREADLRRHLAAVQANDATLARLNARLAQLEEVSRQLDCLDTDASLADSSALLSKFSSVSLPEPPEVSYTPATLETMTEQLAMEIAEGKTEEVAAAKPQPRPTATAPAVKVEGGENADSSKWVATKPDEVRLADVIGLESAKAVVMDALVNPVNHPDIYQTLRAAPGTGLLLYGPPGTGKTLFAKAVANEMGMPFLDVKCDNLKSKYVGESEKNVAELFRAARSYGKCVIFLDECNAILSRRDDQKVCLVEQFLVELDGFASSKDSQFFVLMATNLPWTLDPAITRSGRLSEAVYVGLPECADRRKLLELSLADTPLAADVSLDKLAEITDGYSGADLCAKGGVCHKAKMKAARRWVARRGALDKEADAVAWETAEPITWRDLEEARQETPPISRTAADLVRRNQDFALGGGFQ
ncbi:MAG: ATP-binding protein [Kiritimatiellae bacterium]|nr:ATP-binding protein [Kiritimatiellia bacterium]